MDIQTLLDAPYMRKHPLPRIESMEVPANFQIRHPYRVDLPGGCHLRFASLTCAALSSVARKTGVFDEILREEVPLADCVRIYNDWQNQQDRMRQRTS
jgi:hypothetical protein